MAKKILLFASLFLAVFSADIFLGENHTPGFIQLTEKDEIFYWLFRSRSAPETDPLVIWLTGGPGCASELAIFYENGPFKIKDDLNLTINSHSWNNFSNILYVDQPIGTGFSKGSPFDYATNENKIASDFYKFLQGFLAKHSDLQGRPFFITGESYAGHYIPAISAYIVEQNKPIGNGWVDPYLQYPAYNEFAKENKLIGTVQYYLLKAGFAACQLLIKSGIWFVAMEECQLSVTTILGSPLTPRFNVYDIRKKCDVPPLCYDFGNLDKFIARKDVREVLGVGDRKWSSCNMAVHTALLGDWVTDMSSKVVELLKNDVNVLVYSGDKDFICNWRGGEAWVNGLNWEKSQEFIGSDYKKWELEDGGVTKAYGEFKQAGGLVFLRIYDAGHMVPMDQPHASLEMLTKFLKNWALEFQAKNPQFANK